MVLFHCLAIVNVCALKLVDLIVYIRIGEMQERGPYAIIDTDEKVSKDCWLLTLEILLSI